MKNIVPFVVAALALCACGKAEPKLTREVVLPALQAEAQKLKADGENVPDVGVKPTWTIAGVEVREQVGNEAQPFAGSIRFRIESQTHAIDGPATAAFEKKFDYVYDAALKQWRFRS